MYSRTQSEEDFAKARNKALFNEIQHFLTPEETRLLSLSEMKKLLKPTGEVYQGVKAVPVELIVGSEGRYKDFDNHFFPKSIHLRQRWENVDRAHLEDVILPPVNLYELGGLYFVRDGNHRVSVAKAQGVESIDAEVVSLQSEIKLKKSTTIGQMIKQVIQYEKRVFYGETNFGDITDCWNLDFTATGQYDVIYNHLLIHKYYINQNQETEIDFQTAVESWYKNVYLPLLSVIKKHHILRKFRGRTPSDMYVWIIKYWDELKQKFGNDYSLDKAAEDFKKEYGTGILKIALKWIISLFNR
ncbi:MAG: transcriptional regulator [Spirochaetia bacterium]|nr:transcriptional regulator [Spirochaetia bacterium]